MKSSETTFHDTIYDPRDHGPAFARLGEYLDDAKEALSQFERPIDPEQVATRTVSANAVRFRDEIEAVRVHRTNSMINTRDEPLPHPVAYYLAGLGIVPVLRLLSHRNQAKVVKTETGEERFQRVLGYFDRHRV